MNMVGHKTKGININKSFVGVKSVDKIAFFLEVKTVKMGKSNLRVNKSIKIY